MYKKKKKKHIHTYTAFLNLHTQYILIAGHTFLVFMSFKLKGKYHSILA